VSSATAIQKELEFQMNGYGIVPVDPLPLGPFQPKRIPKQLQRGKTMPLDAQQLQRTRRPNQKRMNRTKCMYRMKREAGVAYPKKMRSR